MSSLDSLKNRIKELANKSINFNKEGADGIHPIVLVDSVKSIISLNFESPNSKLLNWLEKDILTPCSKRDNLKREYEPKNASFKELEEALLNNQKDKVEELLVNFNMLTDGTQLVEFFLEMSLYQSGVSFINIWRSFKIFKFTKIDNKISFYKLLSYFVLSDKFRNNPSLNNYDRDIEKINNTDFDIILFSNFLDCSQLKFIRKDSLKNALSSMNCHIQNQVQVNNFISISYGGKQKDRSEILNLINSDSFIYSEMNILLLDSIRILIKKDSRISSLFLNEIYNKLDNYDLQ